MTSSNEALDRRPLCASWPSCTGSFLLSDECPRLKHVLSSCFDGKMLSFVSGGILVSDVFRLRLLVPLSACPPLVCFSLFACSFAELDSRFKTPVEDDRDGGLGEWVSFTLQRIFRPAFFFSLTRSPCSCIKDNLTPSIDESWFTGKFSVAGGKRDLNNKVSGVLESSGLSCISTSRPKVLFILLSSSLPPVAAIECRWLGSRLSDDEKYTVLLVWACLVSAALNWAWSRDRSSLARDVSSSFSSWAFIAVNWQHNP